MTCPSNAAIYSRWALLLVGAVATSNFIGCSGASTVPGPASLSTVSMSPLSPATMTIPSNGQIQFTVSVTGASNTALVWNIVDSNGNQHFSGDALVGMVTAAGLYTPPIVNAPTSFKILVGAAADTSVQRSALITVTPVPPPVSITISPTTAIVQTCSASPCPMASIINFVAPVLNSTNTSVTWNVNGNIGGTAVSGTISPTGTYTAPAAVPANPVVTVTAVSNAASSTTASAQVTISPTTPPTVVNLNKTTVTLIAGQSFQFTATDNQNNPLNVTYSATCANANCGGFAPVGTGAVDYIAPSPLQNNTPLAVTVTAALVANPINTATASVTVNPPMAPNLSIIPSTTTPILANAAPLLLTAIVTNLPTGATTPTISWTQVQSDFCISSDDGADDFCKGSDNDNEPDGPGNVTAILGDNTHAYYYPPQNVYLGAFYQNKCTQAIPSQPYVYVTASTVFNGVILPAFVCIPVLP